MKLKRLRGNLHLESRRLPHLSTKEKESIFKEISKFIKNNPHALHMNPILVYGTPFKRNLKQYIKTLLNNTSLNIEISYYKSDKYALDGQDVTKTPGTPKNTIKIIIDIEYQDSDKLPDYLLLNKESLFIVIDHELGHATRTINMSDSENFGYGTGYMKSYGKIPYALKDPEFDADAQAIMGLIDRLNIDKININQLLEKFWEKQPHHGSLSTLLRTNYKQKIIKMLIRNGYKLTSGINPTILKNINHQHTTSI